MAPDNVPADAKVKITVVQRTHNREYLGRFLEADYAAMGPCDCFSEGQEFFVAQPWEMPAGFCPWAWADIRGQIVAVLSGGHLPGMKEPATAVAGCTDWLRPVLFFIQKIA